MSVYRDRWYVILIGVVFCAGCSGGSSQTATGNTDPGGAEGSINRLTARDSERQQMNTSGKEFDPPTFPVIEIDSADKFETILMRFVSFYEGHDDQWHYISSSLSSQSSADPLDGAPFEMAYKLRKETIDSARLAALLQRKEILQEKQRREHFPVMPQCPINKKYVKWLESARLRLGPTD